ncbi:unnamed protein product [Commensalibacter communis]|uniref:Uncharacterized protein n=1 Tax=Commensalibacter communis TaxID=2972786 RepID=A0A9W4TRK4_9PROT|nr:hypothetical protein [Commensalibacter communis]CAI3941567.1 unnamed protein product [Commensalibacter communis]CAI3945060.1 unnamed protein product [Commensalibacter communis]CAI3959236.1 unnamed protein product [Commensalibacter communis]CAI3960852.1 unnamed protein product [Commensalibacter communis]
MSKKYTNKPASVTDRECDEMVFQDCCLGIAENPKAMVDDIEAIQIVANFTNPDQDEKILRLAAAIRVLKVSPKNAFNTLFMATLLDYKQTLGIKGEIIRFKPSHNKGG